MRSTCCDAVALDLQLRATARVSGCVCARSSVAALHALRGAGARALKAAAAARRPGRGDLAVVGELAAIVLRQRARVGIDGLDAGAVAHRRRARRARSPSAHRRRSACGTPASPRSACASRTCGVSHTAKVSAKSSVGMRLRVPLAQVMHVAAAAGARAVARRVRQRGRTEHLAPALAAAQPIGVVERVAGLVAQDAHQPARVAALGLVHDAPLEPLQPRVREVERYGDAGHAVGREPFLREPDVRAEVRCRAARARRTGAARRAPSGEPSTESFRSQKRSFSSSSSDRRAHARRQSRAAAGGGRQVQSGRWRVSGTSVRASSRRGKTWGGELTTAAAARVCPRRVRAGQRLLSAG